VATFARAPTVDELAAAWTAGFARAVRREAGAAGRLSLEGARRIAGRAGVAGAYGECAARYLEARESDGPAEVGVEQLVADRSGYVRAAAAEAAGPGGRLSLREARYLPNAVARAFEHLRGRALPAPRGARLARAFATLAEGLTFTSESDFPYTAFSARFPRGRELTAEGFRAALGFAPQAEIILKSPDEFFRTQRDPRHWEEFGLEPAEARATAARYARLERALRAGLTALTFLTVGGERVVEGLVFFVGQAPGGSLSGLNTVRIST
jgi:Nuclease A inhibitor-like protein